MTSDSTKFRATVRNRNAQDAYVIITLDRRDVPVEADADGVERECWEDASYPTRERIARTVSRIIGRRVDEVEIDECSGGEDGEAIYPIRLGMGVYVGLDSDEANFGDVPCDRIDDVRDAWVEMVNERISNRFGPHVEVEIANKTTIEARTAREEEDIDRILRDAWDDFCADGCGIADDDSDDDGPEFALERIALSDMGKPDLLAEVETLSPADRASAEAHRFTVIGEDGYQNSEGGVVLFVGAAGRAGVCMNGDSSWTDASDATDAVRRYLTDDMIE